MAFNKELNIAKPSFDFTSFVFPELKLEPGTQFSGRMLFRNCVFQGPLHLFQTTFHRGVDFFQARFQGPVSFHECLFKEQATFQRCNFDGSTDFGASTFDATADFTNAVFQGPVYFTSTNLRGNQARQSRHSFDGATFNSQANFQHLQVIGTASFQACRFLGRADFIDLQLDKVKLAETIPGIGEYQPALDFSSVAVALQGGVRFMGRTATLDGQTSGGPLPLWSLKLAFSDVHRMQFVNVRWQHPRGWKAPGWRRKGLVFDEQLLPRRGRFPPPFGPEDLSPRHVGDIYKGLRLSYESSLRYAEAGPFHVREMEMRRMEFPLFRRHFGLLAWYKRTSNYGESPGRAFGAIAAWVMLAAAFERWVRPVFFPRPLGWPHEWLNHAISLLPAQVGGDTVTDFVAHLVGAFLITGFVIALRRHLRR